MKRQEVTEMKENLGRKLGDIRGNVGGEVEKMRGSKEK